MRSDVKNIFCLSGGIDSGSLVSIAKKRFNTYQETTEPLLEFYEKMGLLKETAGEKKIGEIYVEITEYINGIQG